MKKSTETGTACEACREPIGLKDAFGLMHRTCVERLLENFRAGRTGR